MPQSPFCVGVAVGVAEFGVLSMQSLNRLSARAAQTLTTPGRHADGGGLYLQIKGGRSWIFLYRSRANGRLREMGLGSLAAVSLADARQRAAAARSLLASDIDP